MDKYYDEAQKLIELLKKKYEGKEKPSCYYDLKYDNKEYLDLFNYMRGNGHKLFGKNTASYFEELGLIVKQGKEVNKNVKKPIEEKNDISKSDLDKGVSEKASKMLNGAPKTLLELQKFFKAIDKSFINFSLSEDGKILKSYYVEKRSNSRIFSIPDGVETIEDNVFLGVNFDYLYIPNSLKNIGKFTLYAKDDGPTGEYKTKNIKKIVVEYDNPYFATDEQGFYALKDGKKQLLMLYDKTIEEYVAPDDVVSFANMAFYGCRNLKKIVVSKYAEEFNEYSMPFNLQVQEVYISSSVRRFIARPRECMVAQQLNTRYRIDEKNQWIFYDEDSIYEVLNDGTYKLLRNTYFGYDPVFILDNTSEIPYGVFKGYENLYNIELPKSLKIIGTEAFAHSNLQNIVIPDGVKRIENGAFAGCYKLKSVKLPAGLEYVDKKAFYRCYNLKKFVSDDGKYMFNPKTELIETVKQSSDNTKSRNATNLRNDMFAKFARKIVKCVQEESVYGNNSMDDRASFDQEKRVIKIKTLINQRCESEKTLKERIDSAEHIKIGEPININTNSKNWEVISSGGKSLGELDICMVECIIPYLRYVSIDSAIIADIIPKSRRRNAKYALVWIELEISECKLTADLSKQDEKLMREFSYVINENEVRLMCWLGKTSKKKVIIPATLEGTPVCTLSSGLFMPRTDADYNNIQELIISEGIKRIEQGALFYLEEIKKIEFPASVTYISESVFADEAGKYKDLYLKEGTVYVAPAGSYAESFLKKYKPRPDTVDKLIVVNDDSEKSQEKIKLMWMFDVEKTTSGIELRFKDRFKQKVDRSKIISIPEFIDDIPVVSVDFEDISCEIEQINIPASVTKLASISDSLLFQGLFDISIKHIEISEENKAYWSDGYAIFSKDRKRIIRYMSFSKNEYTVPEGVEIIEESCFAMCSMLESIMLPKSIKEIKKDAFYGCDKLLEINGIEYITEYNSDMFDGDGLSYALNIPYLKNKEKIIIGNSLVKYNNLSDKIITVPEGITKICSYAFGWDNENDQVEEIILPKGLKYIEQGAFSKRKFLKKMIIPEGVKEILPYTFNGCIGLETIHIPASLERMFMYSFDDSDNYLFENSLEKEITRIEVDSNNKVYCSVGGMLFTKDMAKLVYVPNNIHAGNTELVIPECVKIIGSSVFKNCYNLNKIILPSGLEHIEREAFYGCENLIEVVWPKKLKTIGDYAFSKVGLRELSLPEGIEHIKEGVFYGCENLIEVVWPKKLKIIGKYAFSKVGLRKLSLPEGIEHIGEEAFSGIQVESVELPKSVRTLGWGAFSGILEITVYDSIDPDAKPMDSKIDIINGAPNSLVGYIGIGEGRGIWQYADNHQWIDYTIVVKSTETGKIKYKVWMGADSMQREYFCFLSSAWGNNATFAFKELDEKFYKIIGMQHKVKVAQYRLEYPYELSEESKDMYEKFLENNS